MLRLEKSGQLGAALAGLLLGQLASSLPFYVSSLRALVGTDGATFPPLEVGLRCGEAAERRAKQQATFLGPVLVSAPVGEFVLFVLFVADLVAGYLLNSVSWRLVQIFFVG